MAYPVEASPVVIPFVIDYPDGAPSMLLSARLKDGYATTPGGQVKPGETTRKATQREIFEETGLVVKLPEILTINRHPIIDTVEGKRAAFSTFLVYYKRRHGIPEVKEPTKHSQWSWIPLEVVDEELAHHWLFPYQIFFAGRWQERVYEHGRRHKLL